MKPEDVIALLSEAVPGLVPGAKDEGEQLWRFGPGAKSLAGAAVRVGARWITVEASLHGDAGTGALGALRMQSALSGGIKVVQRRTGFGLRAEIPLIVETAAGRDWVRRQAAIAYTGLRSALQQHNGVPRLRDDEGLEFDPVALAELCAAGGWLASVRHGAEVHAEFASRSLQRVAILSRHGGAIRAAVTLETGALAGEGPDAQLALATFLLRATRSLRWVRAFAAGASDAPDAAGFECLLALPGDDQPVIMALDALATACSLFGCEAEALAQSAPLARHYLALDEATRAQPEIASNRVPPDSARAPHAVEIPVA
jgi:hypothetical protein